LLSLNRKFLLGSYKKIFRVRSSEGSPVEKLFKLMLENGFIDGLLTCKEEEGHSHPALIMEPQEVKIPKAINRCFGVNGLLKRAVQKLRLNKLALFAPACMFDGLNKTQYFGIGCNWTKTAVALKVGLVCVGALTETAQRAEVAHITGRMGEVEKVFYRRSSIWYRLKDGEETEVPIEVHHKYTITACKYCLNLCARGTDVSFVPTEEDREGLFIVRSERGWFTLAQIQRVAPSELKFRPATEEEIGEITELLRRKMVLNVQDILERIELGLPVPKWSDNKLRKFYRVWNSIEDNLEEEVF